ncbi:ATP-binding protein [Vibrio sp. TH_r3]|uniref:ATP-binding protein n=1 Tax=Vibrio sp. TH_r3 TaxID=3082084 RepID=UPI0029553DE4|nr:ATP-binding protein [Vibrio sp. TH_r3]MDV7103387.1 ATP-binding protein [Vibrio sp. TH_r3]
MSIFTKLFVSILLVSVVMLASMVWLINSSFQQGLQNYLNSEEVDKAQLIAEKVKNYYSPTFGWQRLNSAPYLWASILTQFGEPPPPNNRQLSQYPPRPESGSAIERYRPEPKPNFEFSEQAMVNLEQKDSVLVPLSVRTNLFDADGRSLFGLDENLHYDRQRFKQVKVDIIVDDKLVGWITVLQSRSISGNLAESFFHEQTKYTVTVAVLAVFFSFIIAFFLVRHFLNPLKALHEGAKAIEQGNLDVYIESKSSDELAALTTAFNQLAMSLKKQQIDRQQWLSDISHELRTPIAVLRSEIEAIQDGIRKPEPKRITSLHQQTMTLGKLVNDLYELSLSDSGVNFDLKPIDNIAEILNEVINQNELRCKHNRLTMDLRCNVSSKVSLIGDSQSLKQLFLNIVENSIRYTDAPGNIDVIVEQDEQNIKIVFEDSLPGVPDESLPKLFDRLYRVDKSRSRSSGGSGIGLSICNNIVKAHNGTIRASHGPRGGVRIDITLPTTNNYS